MPITIRKVATPTKRIEVEILPAEWQLYIAH